MIKYIHQVLPNFSQRDAVGNDTFLMREALRDLGFESDIFHELQGEQGVSKPIDDLQAFLHRADTALIFHFSIGSDFPGKFIQYSNKKIVRYHNITPPEFFSTPGEQHIRNVCALGREQIRMLSVFCDLVIADSAYNADEFSAYSSIPRAVVSIFRDYDRLFRLSNDDKVEQIFKREDRPTLLFVGRICPNKAQHDLLKLLALYKHVYEEPIGLVLVGGFFSQAFQNEIEDYAHYLNLKLTFDLDQFNKNDVLIAGSVSDEQLATFYRKCTLFCSLSEHEGFGVPLVEAMRFGLPVLAHEAAAVPETLCGAGMLTKKEDWVQTVGFLRKILMDRSFREKLSRKGEYRANDLNIDKTHGKLREVLVDHGILSIQ